MNYKQEVNAIHHSIVDSTMAIIAGLFLIEQINKNGAKVFIHDGIKIDIDRDLVVLGLKVSLKDCLIEDFGESEGLNRTYGLLKAMYFESNDKPMELTQSGREMLESLFIDLVIDIKAESSSTIH
ncbi:hypothetical protein A9G11_03390 [Gilliamella sp. wkB108]|uniref:hypothetical protein n=1 Tax=Gilliamella sp. wkB108 TaxID=3120256 RepID=UPI00080DC230|nr:hypothetical protein [Gilliamella apicola]OCG24710.1 hypothetical protein A9G11_03390 [Gilliamella apicola]